jgi:hypothetical protein
VRREPSSMKTMTVERDMSLTHAYVAVAASGGLLLVGAGLVVGPRAMAAVALGVVLGTSNLWILERLVRVYLRGQGRGWAIVALLKASALFGLVALLVRSGAVDILPLMVGFAALPLGIVAGGLGSRSPTREES